MFLNLYKIFKKIFIIFRMNLTQPNALENSIQSLNNDEFEPPKHLFSDYVEILYLSIVIILGTTINTHVLFKLINEKRYKTSGQKSMVINYHDLKNDTGVIKIFFLCFFKSLKKSIQINLRRLSDKS